MADRLTFTLRYDQEEEAELLKIMEMLRLTSKNKALVEMILNYRGLKRATADQSWRIHELEEELFSLKKSVSGYLGFKDNLQKIESDLISKLK